MANDKGKSGSDREEKRALEKEKGMKKEKSEGHKNYAAQMWHKIEKKAASKGKRAGLKEEVKEKSEQKSEQKMEQKSGETSTKRTRKRRRRRKKSIEKGEPQIPKEEEVPPTSPTAPVNPFQQPAAPLPPQEYEERYKEDMEPEDEGDQDIVEGPVAPELQPAEEGPVNPFEPVSPKKPLDDRALETKPLEEVKHVEELSPEVKEEEKTAEDLGQAKEAEAPSVEAVVPGAAATDEAGGEVQEGEIVEKAPTDEVPIEMSPTEEAPIAGNVKQDVSGLAQPKPSDMEEFKENFWDILEQAGFTKRRIIWFLIVLVIGVFVLFFFVFDWFGKEVSEEKVVVEETVDGADPFEIVSSYIFGLEFVPPEAIEAFPIIKWGSTAGFRAGFVFGGIEDLKAQQFVEHVELLRKMQNIYDVDVYALVNMSVDRRTTLNEHLEEMDSLLKQAESAFAVIEEDMIRLENEYIAITEERDVYEATFFNQTQELYGQNAYQYLGLFTDYSQAAVEIKAEFNAQKVLRDMLANSHNALNPRYEDILANTEALIKGVRVFDVPGSDIEAIIRLEE